MKISIFSGVLLISAALISVDGQTWAQFQNKHINAGMTAVQCTQVIKARGIVNPRNSCKVFNTFITGNVTAVRAICGKGGGVPHGNNGMRISTARFIIVDCKLVNQNPPAVPPHCQYNGVTRDNRRIIVTCKNSKPVHFNGSKYSVTT
ncbi:ribonuclease pancreatic-like [Sander vitreus]